MQIAGLDVDDLADGTDKSHITWIGKEVLKTKYYYNIKDFTTDGTREDGYGSIGGWEKCGLRNYMKETIKPLIPEMVRSKIVSITKTQTACDTSGEDFMQTTQDDIWVPSSSEVTDKYSKLFPNNESRIKRDGSDSDISMWWLRNIYNNSYSIRLCDSLGKVSSSNSSADRGIVLCFCT